MYWCVNAGAWYDRVLLRLKYCREDWLARSIEELDDNDSYEFVKHVTDVHRLYLFDVVMQYRAVFFDSTAQVSTQQLISKQLCISLRCARAVGQLSGSPPGTISLLACMHTPNAFNNRVKQQCLPTSGTGCLTIGCYLLTYMPALYACHHL